jgi:hypothetical protein
MQTPAPKRGLRQLLNSFGGTVNASSAPARGVQATQSPSMVLPRRLKINLMTGAATQAITAAA